MMARGRVGGQVQNPAKTIITVAVTQNCYPNNRRFLNLYPNAGIAYDGDMRFDTDRLTLLLCRDRPLAIRGGRGTQVHCSSGQVWISVAGEPCDRVLARDESFVVDSDALTLIEAFREARLVIAPRAAAPGAAGGSALRTRWRPPRLRAR